MFLAVAHAHQHFPTVCVHDSSELLALNARLRARCSLTMLMPAPDSSNTHTVPLVVLKAQLTCLVANYDDRKQGTILTRDLLALIDQYEQENQVTLLTEEQRTAIEPFTLANPDLDMSPEDIINLVKLVSPNSNQDTPHTSNIPSPSIRPRTSAPLRHIKPLSHRRLSSRSSSLDESYNIDTRVSFIFAAAAGSTNALLAEFSLWFSHGMNSLVIPFNHHP